MSERQKFYITTAIDYPNARPHIGTAFEKIGADVQARFRRLCGDEVFFLIGNDENTQKVYKRALEDGYTQNPRGYCDVMAAQFGSVWTDLQISHDKFIQTTDQRHHQGVIKFIQQVYDAGYIYKRQYIGQYCEGCEEFKSPRDMTTTWGNAENGIHMCNNHGTLLVERIEENWFFKLSAFQQWLLDLYTPAPALCTFLDIEPDGKANEMRKLVEDGLDDISISRKNDGWGIPIPWDNTQVIYVWFDALLSYLTGCGWGSPLPGDALHFKKFWPADVHVIGKDITRFHATMFPAMIHAYNLGTLDNDKKIPIPQKLFVHGFIYERKGEDLIKISKSGNLKDPRELLKLVDGDEELSRKGSDAYRYYFLRTCDFSGDGEYDVASFVEIYNGELANNLGNLASRLVMMVNKYLDGHIVGGSLVPGCIDVAQTHRYWHMDTGSFKYRSALRGVWRVLDSLNSLIEEVKPWEKIKTDPDDVKHCLRLIAHNLLLVAGWLKPYMPDASYTLWHLFEMDQRTPWVMLNESYLKHMSEQTVQERLLVSKMALEDGKLPPLFKRIPPLEKRTDAPVT